MSAKATFLFVFLLIHCSAYGCKWYTPCSVLVGDNRGEPLDALNLFVSCKNDSLANLTWSNTDKYSFELFQIEYQCYNSTNGEQITDTICVESYSERYDLNKIVDIEELDNEDVHCTFAGCVSLSTLGSPYVWVTQTANCSSEDDVVLKSPFDNTMTTSSIMTNILVSSSLLGSTSPSPYLSSVSVSSTSATTLTVIANSAATTSTSATTLAVIANSATTTSTSATTLAVIANSATTASIAVKATNTVSAGISSTEIATGLIAALVTLFGGVGMIILIVICLSFRKWLRKTTTVQFDYEIKQDFSDHVRSVSVYSIDNISTTGSNITVLHSLSIQHSPNFPSDSSQTDGEIVDIKKAVKLEFEEKQQTNPQTEEEMDAASDCSTIAVESPATKSSPTSQHFDGYLTTNSPTRSKPCTADKSPAVERAFQGTPGYIPNPCDDYIPEDLSKNNPRTNIGPHPTPRTMPDPGYYDDTAESAYMSCTSTSSRTNNGYLMTSTFSETSEYTKRQDDFCDESTLKTNSPLLLSSSSDGGYTRHHSQGNSNISKCGYLSNSNDESSPYVQADSNKSTCHSLPPLNGSHEYDSSYVTTDPSRQQNLYSSSDDVFIDLCETADHPSPPTKCIYLPNSSGNVTNNSNYHHSDTANSRNNQSDYVMDSSNCVIPDGPIKSLNYAYNDDGIISEDTAGLDLCVVEDCNDSQITSDGYIDHDPMSHNQTISADFSMTICDSIPLRNGGFSNQLSEMETPCIDEGYLPS